VRVHLLVPSCFLLEEQLVKVRNVPVQGVTLLYLVCLMQSDNVGAGCQRQRVGEGLMMFHLLLKCFLFAGSLLLERQLG
jgi:hypothetical protein